MSRSRTEMPDLPKVPVPGKWIAATLISTVALTVILILGYYPQIPDPMPVHWNAAGEADRFEPKSLGRFIGYILLGPGILLATFIGSTFLIREQSGSVTERGGAKTPDQAHRTWGGLKAMQQHLGWFMFALNLIIMVMMLRTYGARQTQAWELPVFLAVMLVLCVALLVAQHRSQQEVERKYPRPAAERAKWWGILYNDPADKRILVDTGSGSNYTFNIGRPAGRILALTTLAVPVAILAWAIAASVA